MRTHGYKLIQIKVLAVGRTIRTDISLYFSWDHKVNLFAKFWQHENPNRHLWTLPFTWWLCCFWWHLRQKTYCNFCLFQLNLPHRQYNLISVPLGFLYQEGVILAKKLALSLATDKELQMDSERCSLVLIVTRSGITITNCSAIFLPTLEADHMNAIYVSENLLKKHTWNPTRWFTCRKMNWMNDLTSEFENFYFQSEWKWL